MYCPQCGMKNETDAKFCENCGLKLQQQANQVEKPLYEPPMAVQSSQDPYSTRPSSILDGLPTAASGDYADHVSAPYYILSFLFWPIGIFLWAFHRSNKPEAAKNLFVSTLAGFISMTLIFLL